MELARKKEDTMSYLNLSDITDIYRTFIGHLSDICITKQLSVKNMQNCVNAL